FGPAALLRELTPQCLDLLALIAQAIAELPRLLLIAFDLSFQRLSLRAQRDQLDALTLRSHRGLVEIAGRLAKLCLGASKHMLGLCQCIILRPHLGAKALKLACHVPFLRLECDQRRCLLPSLKPETADAT